MEFFTTEKVSASTTKITDITGVAMYLVEGTDRAVLIDTATGCGNAKEFVSALTSKPLDVILTHGHCDHAGGAAPFDSVYLSDADRKLVKYHASMDMKTDYVRFVVGDEKYAEIKESDFVSERDDDYKSLKDGQLFELGGITLEAVAVPGHTQGMTCILNRQERSILFGDACNPAVFLWDEESTSVEEYRNSLIRLKAKEDLYDTVYLSHGMTSIDKLLLDDVIAVCEEIMNGTNDWQPFDFMGHPLRLAKKQDENMRRIDGGLGNIVYNPEKIRNQ